MPARPQSLGMLCPWGGIPRGVSELCVALLSLSASCHFPCCQPCSAGGFSQGVWIWVSCAAGLPRGYLHWQAHACMCVVCSRHAHIIYLFTHIHSIPLVRTTLLRCAPSGAKTGPHDVSRFAAQPSAVCAQASASLAAVRAASDVAAAASLQNSNLSE